MGLDIFTQIKSDFDEKGKNAKKIVGKSRDGCLYHSVYTEDRKLIFFISVPKLKKKKKKKNSKYFYRNTKLLTVI